MKRIVCLLTAFYITNANSQPYSINFSGINLESVIVQNLSTGIIVNIPAGKVLRLSTLTNISEVNSIKNSGLLVYPNPMTEESTLEVIPPVDGEAIITVYDLTGKVIVKTKSYLESYPQKFILSGIKNGLQTINIQGNGYHYTGKLVSIGKFNDIASIDRVNNNYQDIPNRKSLKESLGNQDYVDMLYNNGDRLKYTALSGNNKSVMTDVPAQDKTVSFTFMECKDGDNNYYPIVIINTQVWMAENLKTTKFNNGSSLISNVTSDGDWAAISTPGYCWNDNNLTNKNVYGALYNWYSVSQGGLCPTGWHVPTNVEWTALENYLIGHGFNYDGTFIGNKIAKSLASSFGWFSALNIGSVGNSDFPDKRNATGFTAIPGGFRGSGGLFYPTGYDAEWWSATDQDALNSWYIELYYFDNTLTSSNINHKYYGLSVRCLKD